MMYLGDKAVGIVNTLPLNPLKYARSVSGMLMDCVCPETVTLDFSGNTTLADASQIAFRSSGLKHLIILNLNTEKLNIPMQSFCYISSDLEDITFQNCHIAPSSLESFARGCPKLKFINGEIDCSNCLSGNSLNFWLGSYNLTDFRIKPNTIKYKHGGFGSSQILSNETYISIANGLNSTIVDQSIHLTTQQVEDIQNINGTNNNDFFIESDNGTLSLYDFITTVKGWTID